MATRLSLLPQFVPLTTVNGGKCYLTVNASSGCNCNLTNLYVDVRVLPNQKSFP